VSLNNKGGHWVFGFEKQAVIQEHLLCTISKKAHDSRRKFDQKSQVTRRYHTGGVPAVGVTPADARYIQEDCAVHDR
jgi:hypothetical protein